MCNHHCNQNTVLFPHYKDLMPFLYPHIFLLPATTPSPSLATTLISFLFPITFYFGTVIESFNIWPLQIGFFHSALMPWDSIQAVLCIKFVLFYYQVVFHNIDVPQLFFLCKQQFYPNFNNIFIFIVFLCFLKIEV